VLWGAAMTDGDPREQIDTLLKSIRHDRNEWEGGLAKLRELLTGPEKGMVRDHLETAARREPMEFQWRLEELLEATAPPKPKAAEKPPEPEEDEEEDEPEEEAEDPAVVAPLRPEDLVPIYDDPRGLMIHKHRIDGRWILTQLNPMTGQPQSVELQAAQKKQVQEELADSPYWLEKTWS